MKRFIDTASRKRNAFVPAVKRRNHLPPALLVILLVAAVSWSGSLEVGVVQALAPTPRTIITKSSSLVNNKYNSFDNLVHHKRKKSKLILYSWNSNNNNNNENDDDNDNDNDDGNDSDFDWIAQRISRADPIEIRNDATLVSCYVLCRFLIYDIASGTKIAPGWEIQDIIWLTETFSSAAVLAIYWTIAGLLSRSFEYTNDSSSITSGRESPAIRAAVNVALCGPIWLATEHFLKFGPSDIGGDTLSIAVSTGFVGLGSFMAIAKTLTAEMR